MTVYAYISCAIGAVFLAIYIALCRKQRNIRGLFVKSFVSVCYLLTAAFTTMAKPDYSLYGILIIVAGILGLMGDIYLDQKWMYEQHKDEYLKIGFICFGIGHIFYIWALCEMIEFTAVDFLIPVVFGVVVCAFNLIMEKPTKQHFGKFKAYVLAYGFILSYTTALATMAYIRTREPFALVFSLGCVSFLVSDLELSQMYFAKGKNNSVRFTINIIAYYLAQYLIALTPAFMN